MDLGTVRVMGYHATGIEPRLSGPNPLPPIHMTPSERRGELVRLLALGLVRLHARQSSELFAETENSFVDLPLNQSGHATRSMVRFLLHNTLGAWWAGKVLAANTALAQSAADEDVLRAACSLPDYSFDMLRFVREGENGPWRPASGTFPGWPKEAKAITVLDPCCGSGHFLTEALAILTALRQAEEHLSSADAVAAVLRDNLYGLEIDGRCVQIAAFAVALSAWRIGGWQALPLPHIAWVGAPPPLPMVEFVSLANGDADMRAGLTALHALFSQAPFLGSLIEPKGGDLGDEWRLGNVESILNKLIQKAKSAEPEKAEGAVAARGMADAAAILSEKFVLVSTNVPFLGRAKQEDQIGAYIDRFYRASKSDLLTVMLHRMMGFLKNGVA